MSLPDDRPDDTTGEPDEAAGVVPRQSATGIDRATALRLLADGDLAVVGQLVVASNYTFYCTVTDASAAPPLVGTCVYKPTRGEQPLVDFPDGTLAGREVAAFLVSEAIGWDIVPPTVLRDGPFGQGAVQLWVDVDEAVDPVDLIRRDIPELRRIALFDVVVNNADRKGGHLLALPDGRVQGVDHGICFSAESKLRTVLWGWRGDRLTADELAALRRLRSELANELGARLATLLSPLEVAATAARLDELLRARRFPQPPEDRRAVPWPPI